MPRYRFLGVVGAGTMAIGALWGAAGPWRTHPITPSGFIVLILLTLGICLVAYGAGWADGHQSGYRQATVWWRSRVQVVPSDMVGWLKAHRWVWQRWPTTESGATDEMEEEIQTHETE